MQGSANEMLVTVVSQKMAIEMENCTNATILLFFRLCMYLERYENVHHTSRATFNHVLHNPSSICALAMYKGRVSVLSLCIVQVHIYTITTCDNCWSPPIMDEPPAVEELKRENEAMRKHIQELKEDVDAKTRSLQVERETHVSVVRETREEERAKIRLEMEEVKQKMKSENLREVAAVREETMQNAKQEMEIYQQMKDKEVEAKVRQLQGKTESSITVERKVVIAREELASKHEADMKKLHAAIFELEKTKEDMKERMENAIAADREKTEAIRRLRDEHEKQMRKASQDSRTDNKKQVGVKVDPVLC